MAKRWMANVMDESERFGKLGVQSQRGSNGAGNLRDFQCMRQAVAEMVRVARSEDLRLGFEAAKGAGMNNAIAVTSVGTAVRMGLLGITPAAGSLRAHRPGSRSGDWFDVPLRHIPAEPRECSSAEEIRISAKVYPGRGRLDPQWWCLGIPSLSADKLWQPLSDWNCEGCRQAPEAPEGAAQERSVCPPKRERF